MARGNEIIVTSNPRGVFNEGYVKTGETHYPGQVLQVDATVSLVGGRHTYKIYAPGTDGENPVGSYWIVLPNHLIGKGPSDSYAAGEREFLYSPMRGEELNLLVKNLSGTADDHSAGEKMMVDDSTGKLIATTGSPENEVAVLLEAITDPTADTLAWVQWAG